MIWKQKLCILVYTIIIKQICCIFYNPYNKRLKCALLTYLNWIIECHWCRSRTVAISPQTRRQSIPAVTQGTPRSTSLGSCPPIRASMAVQASPAQTQAEHQNSYSTMCSIQSLYIKFWLLTFFLNWVFWMLKMLSVQCFCLTLQNTIIIFSFDII